MDSSRSILTRYIPDVYVYTDVYKGPESGKSPGYALNLVAESTTGALLSAECAYQPRSNGSSPSELEENNPNGSRPLSIQKPSSNAPKLSPTSQLLQNDYHFPTPEDLGIRTARLLLQEIKKGGCVDSISQWIYVLFITLGPEDVGKVRFGSLTPFT